MGAGIQRFSGRGELAQEKIPQHARELARSIGSALPVVLVFHIPDTPYLLQRLTKFSDSWAFWGPLMGALESVEAMNTSLDGLHSPRKRILRGLGPDLHQIYTCTRKNQRHATTRAVGSRQTLITLVMTGDSETNRGR